MNETEPTTSFKKLKTMETAETMKETIHGDVEEGIVKLGSDEGSIALSAATVVAAVVLKIPAVTWIYWGEKMAATTFGETFADFWSQTLGLGYGVTSATLMTIFVVFLCLQIYVKSYWPPLFWAVMATSSIAGTLFSDFIDRTLHLGYLVGMAILLSILLVIFALWKFTGMHMNVAGAMNRTQELFYWAAILVSNTLGTALGDYFADTLELGFAMTAGITGGILAVCALLALFTKFNHVFLFWFAFVLTRPFGATFGDLLTKSKEAGGLDLGTLNASLVILGVFLVFFAIEMFYMHKARKEEVVAKDITDEESSTAFRKGELGHEGAEEVEA
jgi:uncharacterized membrane-anchored protein